MATTESNIETVAAQASYAFSVEGSHLEMQHRQALELAMQQQQQQRDAYNVRDLEARTAYDELSQHVGTLQQVWRTEAEAAVQRHGAVVARLSANEQQAEHAMTRARLDASTMVQAVQASAETQVAHFQAENAAGRSLLEFLQSQLVQTESAAHSEVVIAASRAETAAAIQSEFVSARLEAEQETQVVGQLRAGVQHALNELASQARAREAGLMQELASARVSSVHAGGDASLIATLRHELAEAEESIQDEAAETAFRRQETVNWEAQAETFAEEAMSTRLGRRKQGYSRQRWTRSRACVTALDLHAARKPTCMHLDPSDRGRPTREIARTGSRTYHDIRAFRHG